MRIRFPVEQVAGLGLVLALHAAALYGLWSARLIPSPVEVATLFVNFIAPPDAKKADEPRRPPEPKPRLRPVEPPQTRQVIAETPATAPTDYVAAPPPLKPEPVLTIAPADPGSQTSLSVGPVALVSELSVTCPQRSVPRYPVISHRIREMGVVVLRVELSETGHVATARVQSTSGFERLDSAALEAVKTWQCTPAMRNGQPARATALQPFNFVIQGL